MHPFKKMIFMLTNAGSVYTPIVLEQGGISSTSSSIAESTCDTLTVDSICWFNTYIDGVISTGDFVYNDVDGTNPIMGGDQYYKVLLSGLSYIALISNTGSITINNNCI